MNFTLHYNISGKTAELVSGSYNRTFTDDEIEQFAIEILDNLYKKIESLSG